MPRNTPWAGRLKIPAIAAPMTAVSGPELVLEACRNGVIGAFPTHNASSIRELDDWLSRMGDALSPLCAPVAANLVVHRSNGRLHADLDCLARRGVELVITSVGSPKAVVEPIHDFGARVFADVASLEHARRALDSGVDGLVLLTAGAGGQTGWANPFAFVRAVRAHYDGPLVLAGGIGDGRSMLAAEILGVDLAYLGTRFIAASESMADDSYRQAVVDSTLDDVRLSSRVGGIPASLLGRWLDSVDNTTADVTTGAGFEQDRLLSNRTAWSAGHSVSSVSAVCSVSELVTTLAQEYRQARHDLRQGLVTGVSL
ncbi:nitronate monooxygenase [Mycobacterium sp.]|uniref:NAD(P)H-dependent flavin oxidoreductase n=1 Tax=Mycobacterium sp. TaxID=1785 RepID=UPI002C42925B|nr:nitronate monooxygenase [Mycobacterium sp.]HKP42129.1 nitronate monooxygenase [Mycobacterium sp.]